MLINSRFLATIVLILCIITKDISLCSTAILILFLDVEIETHKKDGE